MEIHIIRQTLVFSGYKPDCVRLSHNYNHINTSLLLLHPAIDSLVHGEHDGENCSSVPQFVGKLQPLL